MKTEQAFRIYVMRPFDPHRVDIALLGKAPSGKIIAQHPSMEEFEIIMSRYEASFGDEIIATSATEGTWEEIEEFLDDIKDEFEDYDAVLSMFREARLLASSSQHDELPQT